MGKGLSFKALKVF